MAQDTGIVESHVEAPEVFPRPGDQCLHLHFRGHIRGQGQGLVARQRRDLAGLSVYFIHDLLQFRSTSARHDHTGAGSCIGQCGGAANAGSAPRDDGNLAGQGKAKRLVWYISGLKGHVCHGALMFQGSERWVTAQGASGSSTSGTSGRVQPSPGESGLGNDIAGTASGYAG